VRNILAATTLVCLAALTVGAMANVAVASSRLDLKNGCIMI